MASVILFLSVVAVCWSVTVGQQDAFEASRRIAGSLAAEALLDEIDKYPYDVLHLFNDTEHDVAEPYTGTMRLAVIVDDQESVDITTIAGQGVNLFGKQVTVRAYEYKPGQPASESRTLAEVSTVVFNPNT